MMAFRMHRDYDSDLDTSDDEEVGVVTRADTLRAFLVNQNRRSDLPYSANPEEQIIERRGRRQIPRTPVRKSPRKRPSSVLEGSEYAEGAPPAHRFRTQEAEVPLIPIFMQEKEKEVAPKFVSDVVEGVGERSVNETEAAPKRLKIPPPAPQQSPFTKCLRGLMLSPPRPTNRTMSSLRKRLLLSPSDSTEDSYFSSSSSILNSSTNSGGGASSSTKQSTSSFKKYHYYSPISHNLRSSDTPPLELFDDSGVDMSSPIMSSTMVAITPEDAKLQQQMQQQQHLSHHEFDNMSIKSMSSAASSVNSKSSKASINRARRRFRF